MDDPTSLTINTYNQIAPDFAQKISQQNLPEIEKFTQLTPPNSKVLDVGCGACHEAATLTKKGYQVTGIDLSENLLKQASSLHPEIITQIMDMRKLDFPDKSFNAIWAHASILHLIKTDIPSTFTQFHRVLKSKGILYILVKEGQGQVVVNDSRSNGQPRFFSFFQSKELNDFLTQAGFKILETYVFNGKHRHTDSRDQTWLVTFAQKP